MVIGISTQYGIEVKQTTRLINYNPTYIYIKEYNNISSYNIVAAGAAHYL